MDPLATVVHGRSVHAAADLDMALPIIVNAKCQRPGVCNAIESLVVDEAIAPRAVARS